MASGAALGAAAAGGAAAAVALTQHAAAAVQQWAVDYLWLRPNKLIPWRTPKVAGRASSAAAVTQLCLRNRTVTSIAGPATHCPEVVDLVRTGAAVAYSPTKQKHQQSPGAAAAAAGGLATSGSPRSAAAGGRGGSPGVAGAGSAKSYSPAGSSRGALQPPGSPQRATTAHAQHGAGMSPAGRQHAAAQLQGVQDRGAAGGGRGGSPRVNGASRAALAARFRDDRAAIVLLDRD
jgi:hypothetical protein